MLTKVLKVSASAPELKLIQEAAAAVRAGKLVVLPTETVYGIAANALDAQALERLYRVKGRPKEKPFSWHIADVQVLRNQVAEWTLLLQEIVDTFWPGPLTLVVATRGGGHIGFRMPAHPVALALLRESGVPVVAPSANLSGNKSPSSAQEAMAELNGKVDLILDAGPTQWRQDSTVLDLTQIPPRILREGAVSKEKWETWYETKCKK